MSELDLLKFLESYGEEAELADFSPDEIEEMMRELQEKGERPMTIEEFKRRYFDYQDDVKDKTLKKQDW